MAINNDGLYRTNIRGKIVVIEGVPMLEDAHGAHHSLLDMIARFDGKDVHIDIVDTSKEKGRIRAHYGSLPR